MIVIDHRRNQLDQIKETPPEFGVEIDVRNHGDALIVTHDAFCVDGPDFDEWLTYFRHRFLIVNVKEEGMEDRILDRLKKRGITDFFILDESFPFIRKWALAGVPQFALRVSEFEDDRTALNLAANLKEKGKHIEWIWVDSFTGELIDPVRAKKLKAAGFKLCFVSPELHHVPDPDSWQRRAQGFIKDILATAIRPDAVCSKLPQLWRDAFEQN